VETGDDHCRTALNKEEKHVREVLDHGAANLFVDDWKLLRILTDALNNAVDGMEEAAAKAWGARLVPVLRLDAFQFSCPGQRQRANPLLAASLKLDFEFGRGNGFVLIIGKSRKASIQFRPLGRRDWDLRVQAIPELLDQRDPPGVDSRPISSVEN